MDLKKTANLLLNFTIKRLTEIFGIIVTSIGILLFIALFSYSPEDPNFIFPKDTEIKNILGFQGSFISDLFFQSVGFISFLISKMLYMLTNRLDLNPKSFSSYDVRISKEIIFGLRELFSAKPAKALEPLTLPVLNSGV